MKSRKRCPDCGGRLLSRTGNGNGKITYACSECDYQVRITVELIVVDVEEKRKKWKRFERVEK